MLARARLRLERDGRGRTVARQLRDAPPVAFRRCGEAFFLVSTAASPVGRDEVEIEIEVGEGATAVLRSVGATICYQSNTALLRISATVEERARLDWRAEPVICTSRCAVTIDTALAIADDAAVSWTEEVVLGRHDETPGVLRHRFAADVAGAPLLRHDLVVGGTTPGWDGPAVLGGARALGFRLLVGHAPPPAPTAGVGWARLALQGPGVLDVALADGLAAVRAAFTTTERAPQAEVLRTIQHGRNGRPIDPVFEVLP